MSFRENLLRLRTEHNMTQEQLATLVGVSRQSVAKWESERSYPEMDKLIKMTGIFGCTLDELVMGPSNQDSGDVVIKNVLSDNESAEIEGAAGETPNAEPAAKAEADGRTGGRADAATCIAGSSAPAMFSPVRTAATDEHGYDAHMRHFAKRTAWGVALIIAGVALMLFFEAVLTILNGYQDEQSVVLLALLAGLGAGLALIVPATMNHTAFMRDHLVVKDFYTTADRLSAGHSLTRGIIGGVALIFFGIIIADYGMGSFAVTVVGLVSLGIDTNSAFLAADLIACGLFILCIAAAVWCFIYFGIMYSRVHVSGYNKESLEELLEASDEEGIRAESLISQLSSEERRILFETEDVDGRDLSQVQAYFEAKRKQNKLVGGACSIIMILATIVGLCLMLGIPTYSPHFWMAWVIGGLCCGIVKIAVGMAGEMPSDKAK